MEKQSSQTVLLLLSSKDLLLSSPYTCRAKGSVVMFGGVGHRYYKGELNWVPLTQVGGWRVHMDR